MRLIDADLLRERTKNYFISPEGALRLIDGQPTAFDLESVIGQLEEKLKQIREEQSEDCKKHDGYWTPEQGMRGGMIKAYLEILEILKSAANAANGKNGG